MTKVNPNSPYLGIRGGYKGGGRPKKYSFAASPSISFTKEQIDYLRMKSEDGSVAEYVRKLVDADMLENRYIEQFNKGR